MKRLAFAIAAVLSAGCAGRDGPAVEAAGSKERAAGITIVRDDWGIPHIHGKTDADAVFGMIYAQAEDDFNRIEVNYLNAMGRLAEADGEREIYRDLRMKLYIDPDSLKAAYQASPAWLKALMDAWADGLNYYLATHPTVTPKVLRRFEPWMALSFTEGSIGGDIERISLSELEAFYGSAGQPVAMRQPEVPVEPSGSNGIAVAPANTTNGRALLLINPHTSFFFRAEAQVTSDEGLNAYGASTWGQFFIYQGFNEKVGWMHTSSGVDAIDEYAETVTKGANGWTYRYGSEARPVAARQITVPYRTDQGQRTKTFTVYRTHHGPVVRKLKDRWITIKLMQDPIKALTQSYSRTKARDYPTFRQTLELHTNSSNNTIFADADGDIAYFHANFIPRRDPKFDWTKPVDGSDPATEWQGLLSVDESPNLRNPPNGWLYNTNNWPFSAAGPNSPKRADYPKYVETGMENPRGIHAQRVLGNRKDFTLSGLIEAAFDPALPAFDELLPPLFAAYDQEPKSSPRRAAVAEAIAALRQWDRRWSATSIPTSVAVYWGQELVKRAPQDPDEEGMSRYEFLAKRTAPVLKLDALGAAIGQLQSAFGTWKTPWGDINRFQRLTDDIVHPFDDAKPSIPVPFASAIWGSLASFGARTYDHTKKMYGTSGNSFVAVVEFGRDSVRARAVTAGGESGDPASRHFNDQATRYAAGDLRPVYFYPADLAHHTERSYHPGQ
jgi:acyl-homoserine-lactone acylase